MLASADSEVMIAFERSRGMPAAKLPDRRTTEHTEPEGQRAFASEPFPEASSREKQPGEDKRLAVDDPLYGAFSGM
jgi:hypothetical protein